ncbi:hypothetical protein FMH07_05060 [Vibrio parahaemolyticus]|nr:hypothetical protein [Vibrio parahaemolyticus]
MALFDKKIRKEIEVLINGADARCREMYWGGLISNEDNYTYILMYEIATSIRMYTPLMATLHSQKLPQGKERKFGADAAIFFHDSKNGIAKVALIEAKCFKASWDYPQSSKKGNDSHFSIQLNKQAKVNNNPFAIWEQFYVKETPGKKLGSLNAWTSSCFWHRDLVNFHGQPPNQKIWNKKDILKLAHKRHAYSMGYMARKVCECQVGKAMSTTNLTALAKDLDIPVSHILFIESVCGD